MSEYLDPKVDRSPPVGAPRSADSEEELRRARDCYDALLDAWERRNPVSGPRSRWEISGDRLALDRARLDAALRAVTRRD